MLEFIDPTTGVVVATIAVVARLLEAVWKEVRKRSKRAYKLKRDQLASDARTIESVVGRNYDVEIESAGRRYSVTRASN